MFFSDVGENIVSDVCRDHGTVTEVSTRDEREALSAVVHYLAKNPGTTAEIEGHADRHGSSKDALRHGLKLASIVKENPTRSGVKTEQIKKVESLGKGKMLCTKKTAACDAMNRRVVIRIVHRTANTGFWQQSARKPCNDCALFVQRDQPTRYDHVRLSDHLNRSSIAAYLRWNVRPNHLFMSTALQAKNG